MLARLFVVVLMNIDRGALVNQLATGIADLVVPGPSIYRIPERPDPDASMTRRLSVLLADVAEGRDSELLAQSLRNPPGPPPRLASTEGSTDSRFWSGTILVRREWNDLASWSGGPTATSWSAGHE
jgi:hypothetical protein